MKRNTLLSFCLGLLLANSVIVPVAHADVEQRRVELIKVLDEELREVTRLNKQVGAQRPDLMLRMAQVLLEKARLLKDQENQKYLEAPADKREKNKDEYFKESRRYFDQAQKTVLVLLKKFKKFDEKGDAYYILAYNAKELKQEEQSKKFFQKALEESKPNSIIADKSRIALAEQYFNKGSFDKSMALYEAALKNKRDKWWTKDAFNLAWSYFKMGKYDKAIDTMNESYELSKKAEYIDMSKSIERDLAFFYTEAGRGNEAIAFYKKNGKSISEVMLKVGKYLKTQGKFSAAEKTLGEALQFKSSEKEEIDINIELISLYEKFGRDQKHLETSRALTSQFSKGNLSPDQTEILKFNVEKMAGLIQQQLVAKTYENSAKTREEKASAANEYFMMGAVITPAQSQMSYFHAGETFFAIGQFDKAVPLYAEAIKRSQGNKDKKTEEMASNALMVSLGKNVNKKTSEDYLIPAYEGFLAVNPKGDKSSVVYQRLFSTQMGKKNVAGAEKTLVNYKANFPNESETQEKMLAQVMDFHKDTGNKAALSEWAKRVDSNEFKVSPEYAAKVKTLVLGMQFEKVEQASVKGDKRGALKGYLQIYKSPETDNEAKKTAAYNIAVLFYETGDWKQMYGWADRAVVMMGSAELLKFEKDFILFTTDLFQRRQFTESAALSEKIFDKICTTNSKNVKTFFKNANVIYLADKQFDKSLNILAKAPKCGLGNDIVLPGYLDHLTELAAASKWGSFSEVIKKLEASKEMWPQLIYPSSLLANELENIGRTEDAQKVRTKMITYYESSIKAKMNIPLEGLDAIAVIKMAALDEQVKRFNAIKLQFPVAEYNKLLKEKYVLIGNIGKDATGIAELGSGVGYVKSVRSYVVVLENFSKELSTFEPTGKDDGFVKSFKKDMNNKAAVLDKEAQSFRDAAIKKIEKENILSSDNGWFLVKNDAIIPEYFNENGNVLMDKAGAK
ncbi:MAG: tetratricopeptide repeat protein [Rhizobacter sp.]|nr:tetratricopeptide repeat protein [Bacteriovorax sp.]